MEHVKLFRRKATIIKAVQLTEGVEDPAGVLRDEHRRPYVITAHNQRVILEPGDWVTQEPNGQGYYPIKPDILASTYEALELPRDPHYWTGETWPEPPGYTAVWEANDEAARKLIWTMRYRSGALSQEVPEPTEEELRTYVGRIMTGMPGFSTHVEDGFGDDEEEGRPWSEIIPEAPTNPPGRVVHVTEELSQEVRGRCVLSLRLRGVKESASQAILEPSEVRQLIAHLEPYAGERDSGFDPDVAFEGRVYKTGGYEGHMRPEAAPYMLNALGNILRGLDGNFPPGAVRDGIRGLQLQVQALEALREHEERAAGADLTRQEGETLELFRATVTEKKAQAKEGGWSQESLLSAVVIAARHFAVGESHACRMGLLEIASGETGVPLVSVSFEGWPWRVRSWPPARGEVGWLPYEFSPSDWARAVPDLAIKE
jgi:hypothetical protein